MQTELLRVTGMTCGACVNTVKGALEAVNGVSEVEVSLDSGKANVKYDETQTSPSQLASAVTHAGFGVQVTPGQEGSA